jgi:hypothetical protein
VKDTFYDLFPWPAPTSCTKARLDEKRSADRGISHYVCLWATRQFLMSANNRFTRPQPALVILQNADQEISAGMVDSTLARTTRVRLCNVGSVMCRPK